MRKRMCSILEPGPPLGFIQQFVSDMCAAPQYEAHPYLTLPYQLVEAAKLHFDKFADNQLFHLSVFNIVLEHQNFDIAFVL